MDRAQEPDGDYGYDLAHEALGTRPAAAPAPAPAPEPRGPAPAPGGPDPGGDLAYDESHDF
ncbi:hypothetical protein ACI79C_18670 [Geodermatophilus sp. SYSU D00697]